MRLTVVPNVSAKDGVSNKNARLTNCLKETTKRGDKAVVRPGLVLETEGSGVGGGLVAFGDELVSVYGTTLGFGVEPSSGGWSSAIPITFDALGDANVASFIVWDGNNFVARVFDVDAGYFIYNNSADGITFSYLADYPGTQSGISGAMFLSAKNGYFYAWDAGDKTKIYRTANSGVSWAYLSTPPLTLGVGEYMNCLWYGANLYAYNTTTSETCVSADSGATWGSPYAGSGVAGFELGAYLYSVNGSNEIIRSNDVFLTSTVVSTPPITVDGMIADGSTMYIYDSSFVFYSSTDGVTFTLMGAPAFTYSPIAIAIASGVLNVFEAGQMFTFSGGGSGTIPALATIPTGLYDFAQSVT